jgi:hypothetical protein
MRQETYRYFIRLNPVPDGTLPRARVMALQRQQADDFIAGLRRWLADQDLTNKVTGLSATPFGQIQLICTQDVMHKLRAVEWQDIAGIQQPGWPVSKTCCALLTARD